MSDEDRLEEAAESEEHVEAVETEEVQTEETETENEEESGTSEDGEEGTSAQPKKRKKSAAERISELTALRRSAEREAEYWRQYAQRPADRTAEPDVGPKPKLSDYEYDESKYEAAVDQWHEKRFEALKKADQERQQQFKQVTTHAQKSAQRAAFLAHAEAQYEDFTQVVNDRVPISEAAADVIAESENGAAVAYYLGKNLEEAYRINALPEHRQAYEIAKIEMRMTAPPKPHQKTGAPPPPKKVKPSGSVQKNPDEMTQKEWLEWRNKQLKNRG